VPGSVEARREYVECHGGNLSYADVEPIAVGQRQGEDEAMARATGFRGPFVVHDTDLVSTMVYSRHY